MRIEWNYNPLKTRVFLDYKEIKSLRNAIWAEYYLETITRTKEYVQGKFYNESHPTMEGVMRELNDIAKSVDVDSDVKLYQQDLLGEHSGDCIKEPYTCMKCLVEDMIGITTIKGLSTTQGKIIKEAFNSGDWQDYLFNKIFASSKIKHNSDYVRTHKWLIRYHDEHFPRDMGN